MAGLLDSYLDGLDEKQKNLAISQGLLGLGSSLLENQYSQDGRGLARGFAQGGQAMMAIPGQMRQQAYQDAVMKSKVAEMKRTEAEQARRDSVFKSLFGGGDVAASAPTGTMTDTPSPLAFPSSGNIAPSVGAAGSPVAGMTIPPGLTKETAAMLGPDATYKMIVDYNTKLVEKGLEAPKVETVYDPATGREIKQQFIPGKGYTALGGVKAPEVGTGMMWDAASGSSKFVPGWDIAQVGIAGRRAGAEAGARNASEAAYAGTIAQNREVGRATGEARAMGMPVDVGGKSMPLGSAKPFLESFGKGLAATQTINVPGVGAVPVSQVDEVQKTQAKNQQGAKNVLELLDQIEPMIKDPKTGQMVPDKSRSLLEKATNSYAGAAVDLLGRVVGASTEGGEAIAAMQPYQAALMMAMPRMEGPQSDKDVQLYREAAGALADPTVPKPLKRAAMQTLRSIYSRYQQPSSGWSATPVGGQ